MKNYINSLNQREKWMVITAMITVAVYIYYIFLFEPINRSLKQKQALLNEQVETLDWMKSIKGAKHANSTKQKVDNNQLLAIMASQLKKDKRLKGPFQLQQTASEEIQLSFDEVPFQAFLIWLIQLNKSYDIQIKQFQATATNTPGVTSLMIIIH